MGDSRAKHDVDMKLHADDLPDINHSNSPTASGEQSSCNGIKSHSGGIDTEKADSAEETNKLTDSSPRDVHGFVWFLIVGSIFMANFLFATDNTIAANVQAAVIKDFKSLDKLAWLGVAFLASSWGTNFLWGDLYLRFSSKWTFCSSFIVFAVGCAVAGAAPSINALIVGRAICGVGGAGMYLGSMAIITRMTTERERPLYINLVGLTFGAGTVLGPIIGGAFAASSASWRWAFYFNLVVGGVCAPIYVFLLPSLNPRPGKTIMERAVEIDFLGTILIIGVIVCIVMAISFGGVEYAWGSGQVIALFVCSLVLLVTFFLQQHFAIGTTVEHRMFPMHFLKSATMVVLFLEVACCATNVFVPVYFLPLYFQFVKGDTPILAGVRMLPFVAFQTVVAILAGWLVGRTGIYVPWFIFAGAFCISGAALLYTVDQFTNLANLYGYEILIGLGSGAATQLTFSIASVKVAPADIGRSVGWEAFAQLGGPTISLSIANAIFLNKSQAAVSKLLPHLHSSQISTIISTPNTSQLRELPQQVQNEVINAVMDSMKDAYIVCLVGGCLILLLIFRFKVNDKLWS